MSLTGMPLLVLSILLAALAPVGTLTLWSRVPGPGPVRVTGRITLIALCQVTALMLIGLLINNSREFYASWGDLAGDWGFGSSSDDAGGGQLQTGGGVPGQPRKSVTFKADFKFDADRKTYSAKVTGPASHITGKIVVWLPPEYGDPKLSGAKFPVVELFSGSPGQPTTWFGDMDGGNQLEKQVQAGRAKPVILVSPTINVDPARQTECTDVPGGPQVATWLTKDVREVVTQNFRALTGPESWGTMGYSEGGYCAAKLTLQFPQLFRAGVGIAATFQPTLPQITGDPRLMKINSPAELVRDGRPVSLLFAAGGQDPGMGMAIDRMMLIAKPPTKVTKYILPMGGHNTTVWRSMLPMLYHWLTGQLTQSV